MFKDRRRGVKCHDFPVLVKQANKRYLKFFHLSNTTVAVVDHNFHKFDKWLTLKIIDGVFEGDWSGWASCAADDRVNERHRYGLPVRVTTKKLKKKLKIDQISERKKNNFRELMPTQNQEIQWSPNCPCPGCPTIASSEPPLNARKPRKRIKAPQKGSGILRPVSWKSRN